MSHNDNNMKRHALDLGKTALELIMGKLELIHSGIGVVPQDEDKDDRTDFIFGIMNEVMDFNDPADIELVKRGIRKARNHFYRGPSDNAVELSNLREALRVAQENNIGIVNKLMDKNARIDTLEAQLANMTVMRDGIHRLVAPGEFDNMPVDWAEQVEDEKQSALDQRIEGQISRMEEEADDFNGDDDDKDGLAA